MIALSFQALAMKINGDTMWTESDSEREICHIGTQGLPLPGLFMDVYSNTIKRMRKELEK